MPTPEPSWRHAHLELLQGARPVFLEQPGERTVGQQLAARLTGGTIVGLVLGINQALDRRLAHRAGLTVAPVDGAWKITDLQLLEEKRIDPNARATATAGS